MQRLRLYDLRISRLPNILGGCQADLPKLASYVNAAQRRLLMAKEAGDEGWWGTWAELAFTVTRANPVIVAPREVARIAKVNVCRCPVSIQNQWYEYLEFGNGRMPKTPPADNGLLTVYSRNNSVTFRELSSPPQILTIYPTDAADVGKRVLLQGIDQNDKVISTQDGLQQVQGEFVVLEQPFVTSAYQYKRIDGIQKDITAGRIEIHQVDPTTADDVLIHIMYPGETTAWYRRYFLNPLPDNCCPGSTQTTTQVTAMVKLDLIPVVVDTDYCLIQNMEAIINECQAIRYSEVDNPVANVQMARSKHQEAIALLNGELAHFLGINDPALIFAPFGSARLDRLKIGSML